MPQKAVDPSRRRAMSPSPALSRRHGYPLSGAACITLFAEVGSCESGPNVPQFYLRRFSRDENTIFVFDKLRRKSWKKGIAKVASEEYFYEVGTIPPASNADQIVENTLGEEEGIFNSTIEDVLTEAERSGKFAIADPEKRLILARFVSLQFCRTRQFRDMITKAMETAAKAINHSMRLLYDAHKANGDDVVEPKLFVSFRQDCMNHPG